MPDPIRRITAIGLQRLMEDFREQHPDNPRAVLVDERWLMTEQEAAAMLKAPLWQVEQALANGDKALRGRVLREVEVR